MADARSNNRFSVGGDAAIVSDFLVQRPLRPHRTIAAGNALPRWETASKQHQRLSSQFEREGIRVFHFDRLLCEALEFADARDWLLERRIAGSTKDAQFAAGLNAWLHDLPADELSSLLIDGIRLEDLPLAVGNQASSSDNATEWRLPALEQLAYPLSLVRWVGGGVVLGVPIAEGDRSAAVTASTVLNFAPVFDQAYFDFWLASDGAQQIWPAIDGRDLVVLGPQIIVGAVTVNTSAMALRDLAAALFQRGTAETIYCVDLSANKCASLDRCLLQVDHDCLLIDAAVLDRAGVYEIRSLSSSGFQEVKPCRKPLLKELAQNFPHVHMRTINVSADANARNAHALASVDPIVMAPGKVLVFEEHSAAFQELEGHGIEIAASIEGSALMRDGRGPHGLATAICSRG